MDSLRRAFWRASISRRYHHHSGQIHSASSPLTFRRQHRQHGLGSKEYLDGDWKRLCCCDISFCPMYIRVIRVIFGARRQFPVRTQQRTSDRFLGWFGVLVHDEHRDDRDFGKNARCGRSANPTCAESYHAHRQINGLAKSWHYIFGAGEDQAVCSRAGECCSARRMRFGRVMPRRSRRAACAGSGWVTQRRRICPCAAVGRTTSWD